jgi:hypothetical protein
MEWSTERSSALQEAEMKRKNRPWWMWVMVAFLSVGILDAIIGDDGSNSPAAAARAAATSVKRTPTIDDARKAVDNDHYRAAIAIATAIGTREVARSASASPIAWLSAFSPRSVPVSGAGPRRC